MKSGYATSEEGFDLINSIQLGSNHPIDLLRMSRRVEFHWGAIAVVRAGVGWIEARIGIVSARAFDSRRDIR